MAHPRQVLTVFFLTMGGGLSFYAFTTYMQKYLVGTAGLTRSEATGTMAAALFLYMLMHPIGGAISDRVGASPCWSPSASSPPSAPCR
jgi:MHS family alpha-ketoglutarate permease-like MFS transporter